MFRKILPTARVPGLLSQVALNWLPCNSLFEYFMAAFKVIVCRLYFAIKTNRRLNTRLELHS